MNPLIGRTIRLQGIEGVVLAVEPQGRQLGLWIEVTQHHGMLPLEADGARPVLHVTYDPTVHDYTLLVLPAHKTSTKDPAFPAIEEP